MEAIFKFKPKDSPSSKIMAEGLTYQEDFQAFLKHNLGKSVTVTLKLTESIPEKQQLYAFYHKVVLSVAMEYYRSCGYHEADKVFADYQLKAQCAKGIAYNTNTGEEDIYLLDKSKMNKDRLKRFVADCITFLQVDCGCNVPDSSEYLFELKSGMQGFRNVNSKKE